MAITTVLTSKGREVAAGRMVGATPAQAEPKNIGWGTGAATAVVSDVALNTEAAEARVAGTSSVVTLTTTNDTYQVVGTVTTASNQTITEAALSDSASKPAATTASAIGSTGVTSITVASAAGFPGSGNYNIQIDAEVMTVTAGQGTTTWTVTRGVNGSTAATHAASAPVTGGNAPGSTAVTNGTLHAKSSFTGLALNTGDSIAFTFQATHS